MTDAILAKQVFVEDGGALNVDIEKALEYAFYFARNASNVWIKADYEQRINLQKLILASPVPFDGKEFGTPELSLIYQQKKNPTLDSSLVVHPEGIEPPLPVPKTGALSVKLRMRDVRVGLPYAAA